MAAIAGLSAWTAFVERTRGGGVGVAVFEADFAGDESAAAAAVGATLAREGVAVATVHERDANVGPVLLAERIRAFPTIKVYRNVRAQFPRPARRFAPSEPT